MLHEFEVGAPHNSTHGARAVSHVTSVDLANGQVRTSKNGIIPKKRGRPPKVKPDSIVDGIPKKQTKVTDSMKKAKRHVDRFKGVSKEELMQRFLPDRIKHGLDILIIGINPGLFAAYKGHHYAGPGNHFWKCLFLAGLIPSPITAMQDYLALDYGIGLTNIVSRTTVGSKDLNSQEIREGGKELIEKIKTYQPKIAVFNGKGIYEIFSKEMFGQKKKDFQFGTQPNYIPETNTFIFVMPSSSARCAQFPRAQDKVHFYVQIKQLRDRINGVQANNDVQETNYAFDLQKATEEARSSKVKQEKPDPSYDDRPVFPSSSPHISARVPAVVEQPACSKSTQIAKKTTSKVTGGKKQKSAENASSHPHLVKFLCQNEAPTTSASTPSTLRSPLRHLQGVVSEDMKNERVGRWVRTQVDQDYESELPMGYEERQRVREFPDRSESDQGSQQSMISAGVSGSTSAGSTSGYGSADSHPHHARQDRVEMWVREQQYVRQQSGPLAQPQLGHETASAPPIDRVSNASQRPGLSSPSVPPDDGLRPPVPLYRNWGENEAEHLADFAPEANSGLLNHEQPHLSVHSHFP